MFGRETKTSDVMLSMEQRITNLEADVYRVATQQEIKDYCPNHSAFLSSPRIVCGKHAETLAKRLDSRIEALEQPPVAPCVDRNGTQIEIGATLVGGYQVVGYRDGGFDVTLMDSDSPAKSIYYLPISQAVLESVPKKG